MLTAIACRHPCHVRDTLTTKEKTFVNDGTGSFNGWRWRGANRPQSEVLPMARRRRNERPLALAGFSGVIKRFPHTEIRSLQRSAAPWPISHRHPDRVPTRMTGETIQTKSSGPGKLLLD